MHILFVHKNYPAQFGHIARYLVEKEGFRCTFATQREPGEANGVRRIQYKVRGGATDKTHYCSRSFENFTWQSHAVYETMKAHPEIRPDLIVGHSGFGSTLFLAELYDCPVVNYFEWYYHSTGSDSDYRNEFPARTLNALRSRARNAMLLADLQNCEAGYSPTHWQRSRMPAEYQHKLETIFDGIDIALWRRYDPREIGPRRIGDAEIPRNVKIVTYVSRGFESMRGFDIFMEVARRICERRRDVVFVCVGSDRVCYGGDNQQIDKSSFREHVMSRANYDVSRFLFTGPVPASELVRLFNLSDLHIYLTVPFVLSWSLMNALACGCTLLASDTQPVREMVHHGQNGLLNSFYDVDGFVAQAIDVLDDPVAYRSLGETGIEMIHDRYSLTKVLPRMLDLYARTVSGPVARPPSPAKIALSEKARVGDGGDRSSTIPGRLRWPEEQPKGSLCHITDRRSMVQGEFLKSIFGKDTSLVIELGAWTGATTVSLARLAPNAEIIVIEQWIALHRTQASSNWKSRLPHIFDAFVSRCWAWRDRITMIALPNQDGCQAIRDSGRQPDVIFVHAEHTAILEQDLTEVQLLFPQAVLVGDGWHWPRMQRAVTALAEQRLLVPGNASDMWVVDNGRCSGEY